jgi:hypothetical protein
MPNERLRSALSASGLKAGDVAERLRVDPKTVDRWITQGRMPHRRHRDATSALLAMDELYLWPEAQDAARSRAMGSAELVSLFPTRAAVPSELWHLLLTSAQQSIDVLVYAGLFLADSTAGVLDGLAGKAHHDVRVRLLLGDPDSSAVQLRGREEGVGGDMAARIRLSLRHLTPLIEDPAVHVRLHATTLYASLFRFDDDLLVNAHTFGATAAQNPVFHFRRLAGGRLYTHYVRSFESVWETATDIEACTSSARESA